MNKKITLSIMLRVYGLLLISLFLSFMTPVLADRYGHAIDKTKAQLEDFFASMRYEEVTAKVLTTSQVTFLGYATDVWVKVYSPAGSTTTIWASWHSNNGSTGTYVNGDEFYKKFDVPVTSPTTMILTLPAATTVQVRLGGFREVPQ